MSAPKEWLKRVELDRKGTLVSFTIEHRDEYASMLTYDQIAKHLRDGYVKITLQPGKAELRFSDG